MSKSDDTISRQDALKPFCIAPDGTRIPEVDCDNFPVEFSVEFITGCAKLYELYGAYKGGGDE